jgi:hypothetical protein
MFRKLLYLTLSVVTAAPILAGVAVALAAVFLPTQKAQACLPCTCPENSAINCYGGFHVNTIVNPKTGDCAIEVLGIDGGGAGFNAIYASARQLARVPETPEENVLIEQYYEYHLYKLTSGEYQVNVGPLAENKVYVVIFRGCPATDVRETTYIADIPTE